MGQEMIISYLGVERDHKVWGKRFGAPRFTGSNFHPGAKPETDEVYANRMKIFLGRRERGLRVQPWRKENCEHL